MSQELKPCPFCGGKAELHDGSTKDSCFCRNEKCLLFAKLFSITVWNTRPSPWISVEDRLPEENTQKEFLVLDDGEAEVCFYDGDWDCPNRGYLNKSTVTHWQPVELPQE